MAAARFLALGDSYTIGESVAEPDRWPVQVVHLLRETTGLDFAEPEIIAQTGWTTDELAAAVRETKPKGLFDLVTLLIGVNNQYRGRPVDEYREQFAALLATAIDLARDREHVIVLSIPDWGVTPFAEGQDRARIGAEIDAFNAVNREEATRAGTQYVDVTPVSREAAANPELVADDGLHPSGQMYRRWAEQVVAVAVGVYGPLG